MISVLIAEEDDHIQEIDVNIHPRLNEIFRILKGTATFIGQLPNTDIVILKADESPFELTLNRNKLPPPFDNEIVHGPILLVRMDHNADHQDFLIEEYRHYLQEQPVHI